jgi:hypothetical protein
MDTTTQIKKIEKKYPRFYIGFEFELSILKDVYDELTRELSALSPGNIIFGTDGSITCPSSYQSIEIRTRKLSYSKGIKLLEEILSFFYTMVQVPDGQLPFIHTNETCGLHINISEHYITQRGKQDLLYCRMLQKFDQHKIAKLFNREDNRYCKPIPMKAIYKKNIDELYNGFRGGLGQDKYHALSFRGERIEVRCLGNTNYPLKVDEIKESIDHLHDVAHKSYEQCVS